MPASTVTVTGSRSLQRPHMQGPLVANGESANCSDGACGLCISMKDHTYHLGEPMGLQVGGCRIGLDHTGV